MADAHTHRLDPVESGHALKAAEDNARENPYKPEAAEALRDAIRSENTGHSLGDIKKAYEEMVREDTASAHLPKAFLDKNGHIKEFPPSKDGRTGTLPDGRIVTELDSGVTRVQTKDNSSGYVRMPTQEYGGYYENHWGPQATDNYSAWIEKSGEGSYAKLRYKFDPKTATDKTVTGAEAVTDSTDGHLKVTQIYHNHEMMPS